MADERLKSVFIPKNYKTGVVIAGIELKVINIIQGAILATIPFGFYYLIDKFVFSINYSDGFVIGVVIIPPVVLGYLGLIGVGDFTLFEFIINYFKYKKKQRKTYYNPRVKKELKPLFDESDEKEGKERNQFSSLFQEYKEKLDARNRESFAELEKEYSNDISNVFFEDDRNILEIPVEYMSSKEYKVYRKNLKKEARRKNKEAKLKAKQTKLSNKETKNKTKKQNKRVKIGESNDEEKAKEN